MSLKSISRKIRQSAKGQDCTVRLPGVCREAPDNETTVLAHMPSGGMGNKAPDTEAAYACFYCHEHLDGRLQAKPPFDNEFLELQHLRGCVETRAILRRMDLIT